jgi:hypothetical protein
MSKWNVTQLSCKVYNALQVVNNAANSSGAQHIGLLCDKETRFEFLNQAQNYGLDTHRITVRAVELTIIQALQEVNIVIDVTHYTMITLIVQQEPLPPTVKSVFISNVTDPVSPTDAIQIRAIEWLTFDPSQRADALRFSNAIIRRFLCMLNITVLVQI